MTREETTIIGQLTEAVNGLREEVHIHIAKTDEKFLAFRQLCDERHGHLGNLPEDVAKSKGAYSLFWKVATVGIAAMMLALTVLELVRG